MSHNTIVNRWIEYAKNDLLVAVDLGLQKEYVFRAVLTHCQQSTEKYLKAYLLSKNVSIKKTHDLVYLNKSCEQIESTFSVLEENLAWLSAVYIESRYPDDFEDIDKADAEKAIEIATCAEKFILNKIEN